MSQEAFQTLADESKRAAELSKTKRPIKHLRQPAAEPRPVASQTRARSGSGSSLPPAGQSRDRCRHRRGIHSATDPQPRSGRQLDLDQSASRRQRRAAHPARLRHNRHRGEARRRADRTAQLLTPVVRLALAPGSSAAPTIRSFSARDHRRRRSTDVITSTCVFVIGLSLGLVL
jgi:hypothetical protein